MMASGKPKHLQSELIKPLRTISFSRISLAGARHAAPGYDCPVPGPLALDVAKQELDMVDADGARLGRGLRHGYVNYKGLAEGERRVQQVCHAHAAQLFRLQSFTKRLKLAEENGLLFVHWYSKMFVTKAGFFAKTRPNPSAKRVDE
jgi:hypothetical protein